MGGYRSSGSDATGMLRASCHTAGRFSRHMAACCRRADRADRAARRNSTVLVVNQSWAKVAELYGHFTLVPGTDYLQFCRKMADSGMDIAIDVLAGIEEIVRENAIHSGWSIGRAILRSVTIISSASTASKSAAASSRP